jgi:hypothetical protein
LAIEKFPRLRNNLCMALKSRLSFPPIHGGFQFYEPSTGWSSTPHIGFDPTVDEIIAHRKANPRFGLPTDKPTVEAELENHVEAKLRTIPGGEKFLIQSAGPPPPPMLPLRKRTVAGAVAAGANLVKNTVAGIALWQEFFGAGPVEPVLAERRAAVCAGCPENQSGNIFERFNELAAKEITAIFGALKQKNLQTTRDGSLGICHVCSCPNRSNVWTPLDLKLKHLRPETKAALPDYCWVITEEKAAT